MPRRNVEVETSDDGRDEPPQPTGFRFATIAALIRHQGYSHVRAEKLVRTWERYARYAMMSGKTPESTAEHLARFERYSSAWGRDPQRGVHSELVDRQIAEDLRRHASSVEEDDPAHAQLIHDIADQVEYDPPERDKDKARIAADVVTARGRVAQSKSRSPSPVRPHGPPARERQPKARRRS